jgi:hypothetical protein
MLNYLEDDAKSLQFESNCWRNSRQLFPFFEAPSLPILLPRIGWFTLVYLQTPLPISPALHIFHKYT